MARRPKPSAKNPDNKTNSNQSSGSTCNRCGGSGTITVTATDGQGRTISMTQDCPECN